MTLAQDIARRMLERRSGTASAKAPAVAKALINKPALVIGKPAERRTAPSPVVDQAPSPQPSPVRRCAPYVPPRREEPDITALVEAFAPPSPQPSPLPPPVLAPGFRGSCKAVCAITGRQCRMPAHPEDPDRHRNERGPFMRVAAPGQTEFLRTRLLDDASTRRIDQSIHMTPGESKGHVQRAREQRAAHRVSAHAGDATTTGLSSIDSPAANTTPPSNTTEAA